MNKFQNMTIDEALDYCYKHKEEYFKGLGSDAQREWECLLGNIEDGVIKTVDLPAYGMDFG